MDSICMVIDLEGFQLSKDSGAAFLVREFGAHDHGLQGRHSRKAAFA